MRRIEGVSSESKTVCALGYLSSAAHLKTQPQLTLLLELEPAHRVFFRNLADKLLFRSTSPIRTTSRPALFWSDVFVSCAVPWRRFLQSLCCHVVVIAAMLTISHEWKQQEVPQRRFFRNSHVSYYTPSHSFLAIRGNQPRVGARHTRKMPPHRGVLRVASERTQRVIRPPDIKLNHSAQGNFATSGAVAPAVPPAAIRRPQLVVPAGSSWVVAPPSDVNQAVGRNPALTQASVIAPPPDVEVVPLRRSVLAANEAIVAPPPTVEGSIRRAGDINLGQTTMVAPSPQLHTSEQRALRGGGHTATASDLVATAVPPPPVVQGLGSLADGRARSMSGASFEAAPPSSSVQGSGYPGAAGQQIAMAISSATASPKLPAAENPHGALVEELPIRLVGLVLALPSSSYFSNYEVFIAERRISKVASQLIKLVYVSLPYQRRLSEYGLNDSRVFKLRVRRDRSCDESLLEMTWPETDPRPGTQYSSDSPGLSISDRNAMLPCYCTTADDYRKAMSRVR